MPSKSELDPLPYLFGSKHGSGYIWCETRNSACSLCIGKCILLLCQIGDMSSLRLLGKEEMVWVILDILLTLFLDGLWTHLFEDR